MCIHCIAIQHHHHLLVLKPGAQKLFLSFSQDIPNKKFWGHGLEIFVLISPWVFLMHANI